MKGLGRALAGESLFMTTYESQSDNAWVAHHWRAWPHRGVQAGCRPVAFCQKTLSCARAGVSLKCTSANSWAPVCRREGFILQKITGWHCFSLNTWRFAGEDTGSGREDPHRPGHIAFFEPSVKMTSAWSKGSRKLFAGEGLFLATLSGPGRSGSKPCRSPTWLPS